MESTLSAASRSSLKIQPAYGRWRAQLLTALQSSDHNDTATQFLTEISNPGDATRSDYALLVATWGERIVGAAWCMTQPGRVGIAGSIWRPTIPSGGSPPPKDVEPQLLAAQQAHLVEQGCHLIQSWLPQAKGHAANRLRRAGLQHLADVMYMVSLPAHWPRIAPTHDGRLALVECRTDHQDRLQDVMAATYAETMDCPQLNTLRDIEDVLEGYRATGTPRTDGWWILRSGRQDVGCLLLTDFPGSQQIELVYLGLVPKARGKGWGDLLVRYAQWFALQASRDQLVLAVDSANRPARTLYDRTGFIVWNHRSAFIKSVTPQPVSPEQANGSH